MSITANNKKESVDFMNTLNNMLEIIDNIAPLITDNNYLQLCNGLKNLNDTKSKETVIQYIETVREQVRTNRLVQTHQTRTKMKVKTNKEKLCDAEKLKKGWKVCSKCDRLVICIGEHQFSDVCKRINETKKLTHKSMDIDTAKKTTVIHKIRAVIIKYNGFKTNMKRWRGDL